MINIWTDDVLDQFIDGECAPETALAILQAEQEDAILAGLIRERRTEALRIRMAMDLELDRQIPDTLHAAVKSTPRGFVRILNRHAGKASGLGLIAASFVAAVAIGTGWSHLRIENWQSHMIALAEQKQSLLASTVQQGLEQNLSGDILEISDQDIEFGITVRPNKTYQSVTGHWCRSFTEKLVSGSSETEYQAVACRDNESKKWIRMRTVIEGPANLMQFPDLATMGSG